MAKYFLGLVCLFTIMLRSTEARSVHRHEKSSEWVRLTQLQRLLEKFFDNPFKNSYSKQISNFREGTKDFQKNAFANCPSIDDVRDSLTTLCTTKKCISKNCTGVVVSGNKLITAAHCLFGEAPEDNSELVPCKPSMYIRGGDSSTSQIEVYRRPSGYRKHKKMSAYGIISNDLAIADVSDGTLHSVPECYPDTFKKNENCWLFVYENNVVVSELVSVDVCPHDMGITRCGPNTCVTACIYSLSGFRIKKGDSGSPIYCEIERTSGLHLTGVVSMVPERTYNEPYNVQRTVIGLMTVVIKYNMNIVNRACDKLV